MKTGIICALAFIALVNGQDGSNTQSNRAAELRDPSPYKRLFRTIRDTESCEPGSHKKEDCNDCFCPRDGRGWACTRMLCLPDSNTHNSARFKRDLNDDSYHCEPNSTFKVDCNWCYCSADGRSAGCTLMGCPPKPHV